MYFKNTKILSFINFEENKNNSETANSNFREFFEQLEEV